MLDEYGVAVPGPVEERLRARLIRDDRQEDLSFALWIPSQGASRLTALLHTPIPPATGDREVHGNASFQPRYFERACREAMASGCGLVFLHSHSFPGWQGMSPDDIEAERRMSGVAQALTGLPLVGLTVASDRTWSARMWTHRGGRTYLPSWCSAVRTVGVGLRADFADSLLPPPSLRPLFLRTVSVWGEEVHADLARLRIGVVGLGSVGAMIVETLGRMGMQRLTLIDFDIVEPHNLDRLVTACQADVGRLKVDVATDRIRQVGTADVIDIRPVPYSVVEGPGYQAALDCDVLFSCVDRPRARHVLNHIAYSHLIPVVDGGIQVRYRTRTFAGVDWQVQTVGVGRTCLECLGAYDPGDVSTEAAGKLEDPSYLNGLPEDHHFKRNENVFPFAANLASLEVLQFVALTTRAAGIEDFGVQRYRYMPGILEQLPPRPCSPDCDRSDSIARGDRDFNLIGRDSGAEKTRMKQSLK